MGQVIFHSQFLFFLIFFVFFYIFIENGGGEEAN